MLNYNLANRKCVNRTHRLFLTPLRIRRLLPTWSAFSARMGKVREKVCTFLFLCKHCDRRCAPVPPRRRCTAPLCHASRRASGFAVAAHAAAKVLLTGWSSRRAKAAEGRARPAVGHSAAGRCRCDCGGRHFGRRRTQQSARDWSSAAARARRG